MADGAVRLLVTAVAVAASGWGSSVLWAVPKVPLPVAEGPPNLEQTPDATGLYAWVRKAEDYLKRLEEFHDNGEYLMAVPHDFADRLRSDIEQHVWTNTLVERLRTQVRTARVAVQAQNFPLVARLLNEYRDELREPGRRYDAVVLYWRQRAKVDRLREQRLVFRAANNIPEEYWPEEAILIQGIDRDAAQRDYESATQLADRLLALQAQRLQQATAELGNAAMREAEMLPRTDPCPSAEPPQEADSPPRIMVAPDPDAFYPKDDSLAWREGAAVLRARINEQGCATHVGIIVRTGYPSMDQAARRVAELTRYRPASRNGVAVTAEMPFRIRFQQRD